MSKVSKFLIGTRTKRAKYSLGCDVHTTAELGQIQPTFCRVLVPHSKVSFDLRSMVRMSPMCVPTAGRLSLRNYAFFVPFNTLFTPFESMYEGQPYTTYNGSVVDFDHVPTFSCSDLFSKMLMSANYIRLMSVITDTDRIYDSFAKGMIFTIYENGVKLTSEQIKSKSTQNHLQAIIGNNPTYTLSVNHGLPYVVQEDNVLLSLKHPTAPPDDNNHYLEIAHGVENDFLPATPESSDGCVTFADGSKAICVYWRYRGIMKTLRKVFIGLGYAFTPFNSNQTNVFKLLAYFKAWYSKFGVTRKENFFQTNCYKLIQYYSSDNRAENALRNDFFASFLDDIVNMSYMLENDYFSISDNVEYRGANDVDNLSNWFSGDNEVSAPSWPMYVNANAGAGANFSYDGTNAVMTKIAEYMQTKINKYTLAGRKLSDLLKMHLGGADTHTQLHEGVHHLGANEQTIQINDLFSNSDSGNKVLGDFVGVGMTRSPQKSQRITFDTNNDFGVLLVFSCVVPMSGYYQGIMKENEARTRYDFYDPDFDAVGYQCVGMEELVGNNPFAYKMNPTDKSNAEKTSTLTWGYIPRYKDLVVGRNIVNGDISLPSLEKAMLPYTLDRHFNMRLDSDLELVAGKSYGFDVNHPINDPETFKKVNHDGYGDYNRIFQNNMPNYDHYIIHQVFDVLVTSIMKPLKQSFDAIGEGDTIHEIDKA